MHRFLSQITCGIFFIASRMKPSIRHPTPAITPIKMQDKRKKKDRTCRLIHCPEFFESNVRIPKHKKLFQKRDSIIRLMLENKTTFTILLFFFSPFSSKFSLKLDWRTPCQAPVYSDFRRNPQENPYRVEGSQVKVMIYVWNNLILRFENTHPCSIEENGGDRGYIFVKFVVSS